MNIAENVYHEARHAGYHLDGTDPSWAANDARSRPFTILGATRGVCFVDTSVDELRGRCYGYGVTLGLVHEADGRPWLDPVTDGDEQGRFHVRHRRSLAVDEDIALPPILSLDAGPGRGGFRFDGDDAIEWIKAWRRRVEPSIPPRLVAGVPTQQRTIVKATLAILEDLPETADWEELGAPDLWLSAKTDRSDFDISQRRPAWNEGGFPAAFPLFAGGAPLAWEFTTRGVPQDVREHSAPRLRMSVPVGPRGVALLCGEDMPPPPKLAEPAPAEPAAPPEPPPPAPPEPPAPPPAPEPPAPPEPEPEPEPPPAEPPPPPVE